MTTKTRTEVSSADETLTLWRSYKSTKDLELRNRLVERYLHLVKYAAERLRTKLPDEVDVDDLYSAGVFGLMSAIDGFNLERGFKFETYCAPRIRGAILDHLRSMDWVPRLVRSRAHLLDAATTTLEMRLGRPPTAAETASHLKVSETEFQKLSRDATAVSLVSLSKKWYETDGSKDVREVDLLEDKKSENPLRSVQLQDIKALATRGLNKTEKLILVLYYYEELTMKEIGVALSLSESRVSQMHSSIIARLRGQLLGRRPEFSAES